MREMFFTAAREAAALRGPPLPDWSSIGAIRDTEITTEEMYQHTFEQADTDHDGLLTLAEIYRTPDGQAAGLSKSIALLETLDTDGDKQLDEEEFVETLTKQDLPENTKKLTEMKQLYANFKLLDSNGDRTITLDEMMTRFVPDAMTAQQAFDVHSTLDEDRSGAIEPAEYLQQMLKFPPPPD